MSKSPGTHCKNGHPFTRDKKRTRCRICYRVKNPYKSKASKLAVAGVIASTLRSQSSKVINRPVYIYDATTGETLRTTKLGKVQEQLLVQNELDFGIGEGVRPSKLPCTSCGKDFVVPPKGKVPAICPEGCFSGCIQCGKTIPVSSLRAFARRKEKPRCGSCAARSRPKATHCDKGHEFTEENTRTHRGTRACRICLKAYGHEYNKTRKKRS